MRPRVWPKRKSPSALEIVLITRTIVLFSSAFARISCEEDLVGFVLRTNFGQVSEARL